MADKKINISLNISAQTQDLKAKVQEIQNNLNKVNIPGLNKNSLEKELVSLQTRLEKLLQISNKPKGLLKASDLKSAEKEIGNIQSGLKGLIQQLERARSLSQKEKLKFLPDNEYNKIKKVTDAVARYNNALNTQSSRLEAIAKAELKVEKATTARNKKQREVEAFSTKKKVVDKTYSQKEEEYTAASEEVKRLEGIRKANGLNKNSKDYNGNAKINLDSQLITVDDFYKKLKAAKDEAKRLKEELGSIYTNSQLTEANVNLGMLEQELKTADAALKALNPNQVTTAFEELKKAATELGISLEGIDNADDVQILLNRIEQFNASKVEQLDRDFDGLRNSISELTPEAEKMGDEIQKTGDTFNLASQKAQEFASLKSQVLSFFTITGAIQLFRRAIDSAFETVKELDEAMTEIAVVSDFSVGDMWEQLPRFTEQANELGMAIKDVYGATTLYVQQGLDLDNSLKLANETLKMAAVAGMDAADATDAMTAALRGFNMELNEMSAQKVNDVYSELAAISAADTQEISTAMSKVASLAHNVNMEFETTASFLTQGIEATREAPETIGTALKTIVARFAEVKSLYTKGQLSGTDEEGETIDVNKVQTALRSAGISMNAFLKGEEGLDKVLLRLSSRWNDLDVLTQRYIATMASGSRQQSRFIAMMDNYAKTTEFVSAAYNSAGSGQRQFEKTLESLEAKLTKLKNAWDKFAMGLTNNVIIKGAVDTLTTLLTGVNKLIDALSGGQGLIKSVMTLGAVWGGLKLGGALVDKALASDFVQRKVKLSKGDSETVANVRGTNAERTPYFQKGVNMAKEFQKGFQSFKASDRKGEFFLENVFGIDTKKNQIQKDLVKNAEDIKQDIAGSQEDYTMGYLAVPEDLDAQLAELDKKYKSNAISAEEYKNSLISLGASEETAGARLKSFDETQKQVQLNAKKLGTATTAVGGAFVALADVFSMFGEDGKKVASVLATIGEVLVGIGQAIPAINAAYTSLKATHPELLAISAALAIIAGLVAVTLISMKNNSPEAQLEKASKATEKAKEMAEGASQAYDELLSKKSEFDKLTTSLETLTQGTLEWRKALAEANNEVINLQKEFPELEVSVDKATSQLKIDNWNDVLKARADRIEATNKQLTMAQVNENNAQLAVTKKNISNNNDLTAEQKVSQREVEQLKTESNNVALISSLISKYQNDNNEAVLQNLAETILKDITYEVDVKDVKGNGNNRHTTNTTHKETKTSNIYDSKVNAETNKKVNSLSTAQQKTRAEEIFGKDAVKDMDEGEIKDALKNYEKGVVIEDITKKVASLTPDQQELLKRIQGTYTGAIGSWEEVQGKTFSNEDAEVIKNILGLDNIQTVFDMAESGTSVIGANIANIEEQFKKFGTEYTGSFLDQFSADNLSNIASQVEEMSIESAKAYLNAYSEALQSVDKEDRDRLENYLSSIDLSDTVQVLDAKEFMKNLGMDETQIEKFWATANTAVQPYITSLEQVQSLNERISKLGEVRSLVENGEKTFSSTNKESLVSAGFADSNFLQTGIDEWTYIGEDSNDLLRQIDEKVGQIGETIVGGLEESIAAGEKYQPIVEADKELKDNLELLKENGLEGTTFEENDGERLKKMADQLGIDTTNLSVEGIANKLIDAIKMVDNLADNKEAVQSEKLNAASRQYDLTGNFGTFTGSLTDDEQITIMTAQLNKYNGAMEYYEKLKAEAGDTSDDFNLKLADEAVRLFKLQKQYDKTADSIDGYKDALLQGESAGTDYYNALATAKTDLSTLFDVDKGLITDDFVKQYAQDIYNLAEGGEVGTQAFNHLQEALNNLQLVNLQNLITEAGGDISSLANWIDELEPTLEVQTLMDNSGLVSGLDFMAKQFVTANKDANAELLPIIQALEKISGTKIRLDYTYETKTLGNSQADKEMLSAQGWIRQGGGNGMSTWTRVTGVKAVNYSSDTTSTSLGGATLGSRDKGSSSSGSSKKDSTWENPYDKLYNLTEQINEALRQREKLEREYDRILERRGSTFTELRKNYNSQLQSLQKEIALQEQLRAGRLAQLKSLSSETYKGQDSDGNELIKSFKDWGVTKYGSYDPNTGLLQIDWDAIDKVKDENLGGAIEAYISRLEELEGQTEDIDTQIEGFQDKVTELQKEGMQDYLDFEQKVYDAIVNQQQQLIDDFQDLSDKISDSNSQILDSIQRSIDLERQIRDNTQTEEDINEKEARLAYLRRDTSNGNLLEIKQLEEELADDRQNYEDSLIDQQLERLTQQNDDAQIARERQIELMQAQLDYSSKNGEFWNQTYELLSTGFSADGKLSQASQLWNLLKKDEGWKGMSKFGKLNWQQEISKAILSASNGYANWNMYKAEKVDKKLTTKNGISLKYDGKSWKDSKGNTYKGVDYDSALGGFTYTGMTKAPSSKGIDSSGGSKTSGDGSDTSKINKKISIGSKVKANSNSLIYSDSYGSGGARQYYADDPIYTVLNENNGYYLTRYHKLGSGYTGWFRKQDLTAYKTGGIADFTGPAWLDGTKSSPELILNARDTENFIALKDILSSIMDKRGLSNNVQSVGDMYFNIDINVDEISSDYDVEDLSKKIKQELTDSAMYRNVNLVNFIR